MRKVLVITIITLLFFIALPVKSASAQQMPNLSIAPSIIEIDSQPDEIHTVGISFQNSTEFPLFITTELMPYQHPTQRSLSATANASQFIRVLGEQLVAVEPLSSETFHLEITIPPLAESGSFFAMLVFKPSLPPEYYEKYAAQVTPQLASVIAINVQQQDVASKQDFFNITELAGEEKADKINIDISVQNTDIFYRQVSGVITIQDLWGNNHELITIGQQNVLPDHVLTSVFSSQQEYPVGFYKIKVQLGDDNYLITRELRVFSKPNAAEAVMLVVATLAMTTLIYYRKNVMKAIKVFLKSSDLKK